mgnify:FL=1|tara:strand:- start:152 stop:1429 length:1278 start_codon:yes stop_codon:yes gene_type:complete
MKVLIVGSGGREHALAWKAKHSQLVTEIYVAPGNGGTSNEEGVTNVEIVANDIDRLVSFAKENQIDLTIVGPEVPLVKGITDKFESLGLNCFGPSRKAAQLEGSKEFMKDFLTRHGIPTAEYESFSDLELAIKHLQRSKVPLVIKADGLAAGKGVTVAQSYAEAEKAIRECLEKKSFGDAGNKVVIEEFLEGEEASFIVLTDGKTVLPFASSQDHKTRDNQDKGPNTGGMGAYSPTPVVTSEVHERIMDQVITPTIEALAKEGIKYCGFLYAGLMVDKEHRIKVLEFNCRFGDPETQPILMRLESDLIELCYQASKGKLKKIELQWNPKVALGVVMAAGGYPYNYEKGHPIVGLPPETKNLKVFHAGTQAQNSLIKTNGGRVLCVTALGKNTEEAQLNAYNCVKQINWKDCFYRTDIGYRAIKES